MTTIDGVVDPLHHRYELYGPGSTVKLTLPPAQNSVAPPTQTRANPVKTGQAVRQSVLSRSAKFGVGRKDVGIKALFCVGGEPLWLIFCAV